LCAAETFSAGDRGDNPAMEAGVAGVTQPTAPRTPRPLDGRNERRMGPPMRSFGGPRAKRAD
jgi:hypothetical protein